MTRHSAVFTNLLFAFPWRPVLSAAATLGATIETATIPFTFSADHQQFPAGTYEVRRLSDGLMSLSNLETGKIQLLMVRLEGGRVVQTRGRLIFHRDETGNSLTQAWLAEPKSTANCRSPECHQTVRRMTLRLARS